MLIKQSAMRYGHIAGNTSIGYHHDGEKIITAGHDGDIRVWDGFHDDDPMSACIAECIWSMLEYDDRILIANELNTVQAYKFPQLEKDGIEFRFTAFVTGLACNERFLAAGSEDGTIKVKPLGGGEEFELSGLDGPVLTITISVKDLLAASCGDGKLRIWDLNQKELVKTVDGLRKAKTYEDNYSRVTPSFDSSRGKIMVYPKDRDIIAVNTSTWEQHKIFNDPDTSSDFTCCALSPMGDFVAAGTENGEIFMWEYKSGEALDRESASVDNAAIVTLVWRPNHPGELLVCDSQGQVGNVVCVFEDAAKEDNDENDVMTMAEKEATGLDNDDDDDIDIAGIYQKNVVDKKETADLSDDENCFSIGALKSQYTANDDPGKDIPMADDPDEVASQASSHSVARSFPMQSYFQSGSTPSHLEHHYLAYNHVGIVKAYNDDTMSIDVEFHDAQKHHAFHIANHLQHDVAALSETVVALACKSSGDHGSKLVCINLVAFGNREWTYSMPDTEEIIGLTASDKIVAVATDKRLLRVFSSRGTQREVLSIPGPMVSMAAYGDHILVAYHRSPASEDQHLNLMIITCVKFKLRCREIPIPLSVGAEMRWLGYSDKGSPIVYDSAGILRLYHAVANLWFPIMDAVNYQTGASDSLFIVKVSESVQEIQLIVCRGAKYPLINPRPIAMNAFFRLPLCDIEIEKSVMEDQLVRCIYMKSTDASRTLKETAIKLFAIACLSETEQRAKELIEMIASGQVTPLAIKYANRIKRYHLGESLSLLMPSFQEQDNQEEQQELESARENAAMVRELEHINQEAIAKKDNTPKIKPQPMVMKSTKGNPFKLTGSTAKSATPKSGNMLGHLTSKAFGYSPSTNGTPKRDETADDVSETPDTPADDNSENRPKNSNGTANGAGGMKFMPWFECNKDQLKKNNPLANDTELVKIGMKEYRALQTGGSSTAQGEKRKLTDDEKGESGVSKLAKFTFVKN